MKQQRLLIAAFLLVIITGACKVTPVSKTLLRSTPESEGVSSQGIIEFLDAAATGRHEFHSFIFLRHGKVIAEGWWDPYKPDLRHTLYSTSKSFTATAVGFAVSEKKLTVNDKVISFFPDNLPDTVSPFLSNLTVKNLLTMTAGQDPDPTFGTVVHDSNWVKAFLSIPVVNKPGSKFLYNSLATFMLSAIVQKVTGEKVVDYLRPRLFNPLDIEGMDWEINPQGINTGGWGLRLKTEDMAKFGQLFLQKGSWNGNQVLPASWIEEATTAWIDQAPDTPQSKKDSSDWMQGYCYQMWRCRNNGFRADGAYGQFIIVLPDKDAVIAITAESSDMQDEINLVWKHLLPAIKADKLPANEKLATDLKQKISTLALYLPAKITNPKVASEVSGKKYALEPNDKHLKSMNFNFIEDVCHVSFYMDTVDYPFVFGAGNWMEGETTLLGPNLLFPARYHFKGLPPSKVAGSYSWKDENTVELILRYIESPHRETITCKFDKNKIRVDIQYSNSTGNNLRELKGEIRN